MYNNIDPSWISYCCQMLGRLQEIFMEGFLEKIIMTVQQSMSHVQLSIYLCFLLSQYGKGAPRYCAIPTGLQIHFPGSSMAENSFEICNTLLVGSKYVAGETVYTI